VVNTEDGLVRSIIFYLVNDQCNKSSVRSLYQDFGTFNSHILAQGKM
jgi:hypothetical protein